MSFTLPDREQVVVRSLLERNAERWPDDTFVLFEDGSSWTFRQARDEAYRAAHGMREAGICQDDKVVIIMGNGPDFFRAWWGASVLGAVLCPIHTAAKGNLLAHLMRTISPAAVVADGLGMDVLSQLDDQRLVPAVCLGPLDLSSSDTSPPTLERRIELWDHALWLATSGTTGASKVVTNTYLHAYLGGVHMTADRGRGRDDSFLVDLPLIHGAALWISIGCLASGTGIAVRSKPDFAAYWEVAAETKVTMAALLGSMVPFLLSQPHRRGETEHQISAMQAAPIPADVEQFQKRFNIPEIYTSWGMTEIPGPIHAVPGDPLVNGYIGRVRQGFEVRLVDEHDIEVHPGQTGEIVVRSAEPWMITNHYVGDIEATAKAWRNGWFHSGDLARVEDGMFFFVGRQKEALRRRGENISILEVEAEVSAHPAVERVACVGVYDEESAEDEVKVWIVPSPSASVDFEDLLRYLVERMPYFMVPRYFEIIDELPLTPSQKVRRVALREKGNGPQTWDRAAHGWHVDRDGLHAR